MANEPRILLVTGRLAETALRRTVAQLAGDVACEICVLPITVAALMHVDWVRRKLTVPPGVERVILPGWCQGELPTLESEFGVPFERGPKDLHELPEFFGQSQREPADLSRYDTEIIAEINHATRLDEREVHRLAERYRASGADVIDIGCVPGESSPHVAPLTLSLRREGFRVSIDSFDQREVEEAVAMGAELILSCSSYNRDWCARLGTEVVVIPDYVSDLNTVEDTLAVLCDHGTPYRIDPIIEPLGCGFTYSLSRYIEARRRWPAAEIMMGVGNISEMVEVDSAGVNVLLAGICQELGIRSVLTTEVINWARSSVAEFDAARRLMKYAVDYGTVPKHIDSRLVMLRDARLSEFGAEELQELAGRLTDPNYRIFAEGSEVHVMNRDGHWHGQDAFALFEQFAAAGKPLDASHAFYLGYELCKAVTALTLGKQYRQDEALNWGMLTVPEESGRRHRPKAQ